MSHTTNGQIWFSRLPEVKLQCAVRGTVYLRNVCSPLPSTVTQAIVKVVPVRRLHRLLSYLGASTAPARNKNKNWSGQKHEQLSKTECGDVRTGLKKGELAACSNAKMAAEEDLDCAHSVCKSGDTHWWPSLFWSVAKTLLLSISQHVLGCQNP